MDLITNETFQIMYQCDTITVFKPSKTISVIINNEIYKTCESFCEVIDDYYSESAYKILNYEDYSIVFCYELLNETVYDDNGEFMKYNISKNVNKVYLLGKQKYLNNNNPNNKYNQYRLIDKILSKCIGYFNYLFQESSKYDNILLLAENHAIDNLSLEKKTIIIKSGIIKEQYSLSQFLHSKSNNEVVNVFTCMYYYDPQQYFTAETHSAMLHPIGENTQLIKIFKMVRRNFMIDYKYDNKIHYNAIYLNYVISYQETFHLFNLTKIINIKTFLEYSIVMFDIFKFCSTFLYCICLEHVNNLKPGTCSEIFQFCLKFLNEQLKCFKNQKIFDEFGYDLTEMCDDLSELEIEKLKDIDKLLNNIDNNDEIQFDNSFEQTSSICYPKLWNIGVNIGKINGINYGNMIDSQKIKEIIKKTYQYFKSNYKFDFDKLSIKN